MTPFTWTSHPLRDEPMPKSVFLILIILSSSFIIGWSFQSYTFALVSCVLLSTAMSRYFLPTRYTLDENGFVITHLGFKKTYAWSQFHRADPHPDGIFLSPFTKPHRLDTFRGQFLKAGTQTPEVFHVIQQRLKNKAT